jgi:phospholipid transport system transporter-binding protein
MITRQDDLYRLEGPITMANVRAVMEEGVQQFQEDTVKVDLSAVGDVDSSAVSLLLQWLRDANARGRKLQFVNLPANLSSLAKLYGVEELLQ